MSNSDGTVSGGAVTPDPEESRDEFWWLSDLNVAIVRSAFAEGSAHEEFFDMLVTSHAALRSVVESLNVEPLGGNSRKWLASIFDVDEEGDELLRSLLGYPSLRSVGEPT